MTTGKAPSDTPRLIEVRATVNLAGLRAGTTALVDPAQPYIDGCIEGGYLVRVEPIAQA